MSSFTQWLRDLKSTWHRPGKAGNVWRAARRRSGFRPSLEILEDRTTPASLLVTSAADPAVPMPGTLRYAVNQANHDAIIGQSDTITFNIAQMGTSTVTLLRGPLLLDVNGGGGPVGTETIDGGSVVSVSGNHASGVFQVNPNVQAALTGLNILHGKSDYGGGIYNSAFATLTVNNAYLSDNTASAGGGIFSYISATLILSNTTLGSNSASFGGGIYNDDGALAMSNAILSGNSATNDGGAIYNDAGTMTVTSAIVSGNSAGKNGGGIKNRGGTLAVSDTTLNYNSAEIGAGIYNSASSTVIVTSATLSGNAASICGGGINNKGTMTVTNATFSGNSVINQIASTAFVGGGIYNDTGGTLTVTNATLSGNSVSYTGGGIANAGTLTMQSTIVAGNTRNDGFGHSGPNDVAEFGRDGGSSYNLIGDGTDSGLAWGFFGNQMGNHDTPINPRLAPLGNYGSPTQTMALLPGSLAIGQGAPAGAGVPTTDQRGFPRPTASPVDVGAFQTQSSLLRLKTTAVFGGLAGKMSLREAVNLANVYAAAGASTTITFDTDQMGTSLVTLLDGPLVLDVSGALVPVGTETIDGSGVTVSSNHASGVFQINSGVQAALTGLTIRDGNAVDGGGIYNNGALAVSNTTLSDNSASEDGGGIFNDFGATLAVTNVTLNDNSATNDGGGILNAYFGTATVTSATLSGNYANNGGGIANLGTLAVTSATLSGNAASAGGGIGTTGTLTMQSTIVAVNTATFAPDLEQQGADGGSADNLIGDGTDSGLSDGVDGNQVGGNGLPVLDPLLAPLGDYGGPTQTMALLPGSPALASGAFAGTDGPTSDQRGLPWPTSGQVDIGAYQTQTTAVAVDSAPASYSAAPQDVTLIATVTDNGGPMPFAQGSVDFTVLMPDGTDLTATAAIDASGTATTTVTLPAGLIVGSYAIAVSYSDSAAVFGPSSGSNSLDVQPATPFVGVIDASLLFSATVNHSVMLTATITAGGLSVGEGSVSFVVSAPSAMNGDPPIVLATTAAVPVNALGVARTRIPVPAGSLGGVYTISASFTDVPGTGNYGPASGAGTLTISPTATTVTLNAVPARTFRNGSAQQVSLIAHVKSPSAKVTTGSVTFTFADQPSVTALVNAQGAASAILTIPAGTAADSYAITVTYADFTNAIGDTNFAGSSAGGTLVIKLAATKVTASGSVTYSASADQQATLTARVTSGGGNVVNDGTVTFTYAGQLVTGTVNSQGVATAQVTVTAGTAAGAYPFTVAYGGSANFLPSTVTGTLTVKPHATQVTIAPARVAFSASVDQQVTVTATVKAGPGNPVAEGSVTFVYGTQTVTIAVNSQGVATATLTVPAGTARGKYRFTASYADILNDNNKLNYNLSTGLGTLEVI